MASATTVPVSLARTRVLLRRRRVATRPLRRPGVLLHTLLQRASRAAAATHHGGRRGTRVRGASPDRVEQCAALRRVGGSRCRLRKAHVKRALLSLCGWSRTPAAAVNHLLPPPPLGLSLPSSCRSARSRCSRSRSSSRAWRRHAGEQRRGRSRHDEVHALEVHALEDGRPAARPAARRWAAPSSKGGEAGVAAIEEGAKARLRLT